MNRDNYKKAFSQVSPSEEVIGRIFDMTEKKSKKFRFKGVLIAAAVIILMICTLVAADAATDGDVFKLEVNGRQVNIFDYIITNSYTYTDEEGELQVVYEIEDEEQESIAFVQIDMESGVSLDDIENAMNSVMEEIMDQGDYDAVIAEVIQK